MYDVLPQASSQQPVMILPSEPEESAVYKAVFEEVAAVLPKCVSKALTPPVTIKNFFKRVDKAPGQLH